MKYTETRQGRLPFATGHRALCNTYDLSAWRANIERVLRGETLDRYDRLAFPQFFWAVITASDRKFSRFFEENSYEYEYWYEFDPETFVLKTNYARCPSYTAHHVGRVCPVCGQDG